MTITFEDLCARSNYIMADGDDIINDGSVIERCLIVSLLSFMKDVGKDLVIVHDFKTAKDYVVMAVNEYSDIEIIEKKDFDDVIIESD